MTHKEQWECDICGRLYDSEADAVACENTHVMPKKVSVIDAFIRPGKSNKSHAPGAKYPKRLLITMSDGSEVEYCEYSSPLLVEKE